jgi:hypothetical protein
MLKNRGVLAFVTDGLVRDLPGLLAVGLPVYCAGLTPNSPVRNGPGTVGLPVVVGGVHVEAGDIVVADQDGVVIVPRGQTGRSGTAVWRTRGRSGAGSQGQRRTRSAGFRRKPCCAPTESSSYLSSSRTRPGAMEVQHDRQIATTAARPAARPAQPAAETIRPNEGWRRKGYSVAAMRELARRALPRPVFDFADGGAEDERTLRRNEEAFAEFDLLPNRSTGRRIASSPSTSSVIACRCR